MRTHLFVCLSNFRQRLLNYMGNFFNLHKYLFLHSILFFTVLKRSIIVVELRCYPLHLCLRYGLFNSVDFGFTAWLCKIFIIFLIFFLLQLFIWFDFFPRRLFWATISDFRKTLTSTSLFNSWSMLSSDRWWILWLLMLSWWVGNDAIMGRIVGWWLYVRRCVFVMGWD